MKRCLLPLLLLLVGTTVAEARQTQVTVHFNNGTEPATLLLNTAGGIYFSGDTLQFVTSQSDTINHLNPTIQNLTMGEYVGIAAVEEGTLTITPNPVHDRVRISGIGLTSQQLTVFDAANNATFYDGSMTIGVPGADNDLLHLHVTTSGNAVNPGSGGGGGWPGGGGWGGNNIVFSSPDVTSGSYTYFTGITIEGGSNWHGFYTGASATTTGNGTSVNAQ